MLYIRAIFCLFFPPSKLKNRILSLFGWKINKYAKIGFSFIYSQKLKMGQSASIGHFNFIKAICINMDSGSHIQHLNRIAGPLYLVLQKDAAIGNLNTIKRAYKPVSWGKSILKLDKGSKITSKHLIDCTRPIFIGKYSIVAGQGSQLWTHGYIHAPKGPDRFRIDGSIKIADNVYIGSATVINPGVFISNSITVGSHSTVSKPLLRPGLYVSHHLRYIPLDYEVSKKKYDEVKIKNNIEHVVHKKCQK